jgi:predicted dehydrogenase
VVTDKAMCLTVEEARSMLAARDRARVLFSVFHNRRWDSDFLTVRKIVGEGLIGRLYHIQSTVTGSLLWGGWRTLRKESGGWMFDWGAHMIDQTLLLTADTPKSVHAFIHHRFQDPCEVEDFVSATVTFAGGVTATLIVGNINRLLMPRWYVMGETGTLQCDTFDTPIRVKSECRGLEGETVYPLLKGEWDSFYRNIGEVLAGTAELAVKPEEMVPQIAIAQAIYRSVESGEVVRL